MSGHMYPACIHHAYANDRRGVWLREPCWIPGCPGTRPHPDVIIGDQRGQS